MQEQENFKALVLDYSLEAWMKTSLGLHCKRLISGDSCIELN